MCIQQPAIFVFITISLPCPTKPQNNTNQLESLMQHSSNGHPCNICLWMVGPWRLSVSFQMSNTKMKKIGPNSLKSPKWYIFTSCTKHNLLPHVPTSCSIFSYHFMSQRQGPMSVMSMCLTLFSLLYVPLLVQL